MQLCIFNPEHDLCLGNGRAHYMPPQSAVDFARHDAYLMSVLYPGAACCSAYDKEFLSTIFHGQIDRIIPWGWNAVLRQQLADSGIDPSLLPPSGYLEQLRRLQHRSTLLPLQPESRMVNSAEAVETMLRTTPRLVLKAPWSGSGRGLRWIDGPLSEQDRSWIARTVERQYGVIAEPWREVRMELALEYETSPRSRTNALYYKGVSLFESRHGVYRGNWILDDDTILQRTGLDSQVWTKQRSRIERWLRRTVVPNYRGPLGVDLLLDNHGLLHVSELNLRHTMGMVAHTLHQRYPLWHGLFASPTALHRVVLSLGSNLGNRPALLRRAVRALSETVGPVVRQSSVVETEPWGFQCERNFLNQVVTVETALSAEQVLRQVLDIEQKMGRRRDYDPLHPPATHRYESRPIDIDLIFYDDAVIETPLLQLPHPRMHLRRFVLEPLCEIMPDFVHPVLKKTMKELIEW